jgi:hypothetical protein
MPRRRKDTTEVVMPIARESELILPEFFAREVMKKGKISYKLVNPMTKTRNLSSRKGEPVIKLSRRPVEHIVLDEENKEIPIDLFPKKDREMIKNHFRVVEHNKRVPFADDVPLSKPFKNKERGRPTHLPKNIAYHKKVQKNMVNHQHQVLNTTLNLENYQNQKENLKWLKVQARATAIVQVTAIVIWKRLCSNQKSEVENQNTQLPKKEQQQRENKLWLQIIKSITNAKRKKVLVLKKIFWTKYEN